MSFRLCCHEFPWGKNIHPDSICSRTGHLHFGSITDLSLLIWLEFSRMLVLSPCFSNRRPYERDSATAATSVLARTPCLSFELETLVERHLTTANRRKLCGSRAIQNPHKKDAGHSRARRFLSCCSPRHSGLFSTSSRRRRLPPTSNYFPQSAIDVRIEG